MATGTTGVGLTLASITLADYSAAMGAVGVTLGVVFTAISIVSGVDAFLERRRLRRQQGNQ